MIVNCISLIGKVISRSWRNQHWACRAPSTIRLCSHSKFNKMADWCAKEHRLDSKPHANTSLKYHRAFCFLCYLFLASIQPLRASSNACLCTLYSNFVLLDIHYSAQFLCKIAMYLLGEMLAQELCFFFFFFPQEVSLLFHLPVEWPLMWMKSMDFWETARKQFSARVMILLSLFWLVLHSWLNMSRLSKIIILVR